MSKKTKKKETNKNKEKNKNNSIMYLLILTMIILTGIFLYLLLNNSNNIQDENKENNYENKNNIQEDKSYLRSSNSDRYILKKQKPRKSKIININLTTRESKTLIDGKIVNIYSYNNLSPGPIIRAQKGDTLNITLINKLKADTTIHWHGLVVPNEMDGVPGVTQKPVKPNQKFTYIYTLNQTGVYWYHSHVDTTQQVGKGLYGIIIIDENNTKNKIKYDKEQIIDLDDIRLNRYGQISQFGSMMDARMAGRYGNTYYINAKTNLEINGTQNSIIKLDLLNTANARIFKFGIEEHKLLVIGNDIEKIEKPYETDSIILAPGERAQVLILLNKTNKKKFKIINYAARTPEIIGELKYNNQNNNYNNKKEIENKTNYYNNLIKEKLNVNLPDWSNKLSQKPDLTFELYASMTEDGFKWTINGNYYPEKPDIQNLEIGKFYKARYINKQRMIHPMHIHGQKFIILARNGVPVNDTMYRDIILVFPGEEVDIGFIAQGEGKGVNHCHILEHEDRGMMGQFLVT